MRSFARCAVATAILALAAPATATFTTFESGQVRPLAMSPDGTRLFVCNTPDDRLDIFSIGAGGALTKSGSVTVGLEPVAVAARSNAEVWVVNHLSDSVSIVDVSGANPRVVRTLLVGDEPRDIVFAGPGGNRAFITTARRGQNMPATTLPRLTEEGVPRALVWVFDATNLGTSLAGNPVKIVELFADTPRALAVAPGGGTVYAAAFHSGNRTTTVNEGVVCDGGAGAGPCTSAGQGPYPGGLPAPNQNVQNITGPETGLIVKFNGTNWVDELNRSWNNAVKFELPDLDVFAIDANAASPAQTASFAHVGTVLFNMVTNPVNGRIYVSNTDANNAVRFEGPGILGTTVRGNLAKSRITVINGATVTPRHLNKHIVYDDVPSPAGVAEKSLSTPTALAISSTGATLYVAAFGSGKVGVFDTTKLENDSFTPNATDHIELSQGGPSGLVLDEPRNRIYVLTRFDNGVSVVDTTTRTEVGHVLLHNPEPASVVGGRPVLYDALLTSSNGEASCASCHIFGDFDSLAWDLGNPDDNVLNNPNPIRLNVGQDPDFHPMKGPMTTQSLRGMANHGPMHWRGDRTGGNDLFGDPLDEDAAFKKFIVAFEGLLGRDGPISGTAMGAFTDFILQLTYPPNPIRKLDNALTDAQQGGSQLDGETFFLNTISDTVFTCNGCHVLNPGQGFFGSDGFTTFENETQLFKIAHLRNAYQKVGMFGMPASPFIRTGNNGALGPQVRGFGFLHDGSIDTIFRFVGATVFSVTTQNRLDLEQFVLAFDSNLKPMVGQQVTLTSTNGAVANPRIDDLIARAAQNDCEVVVKGVVAGEQRGSRRLASGQFRSDRASEPLRSDAQIRAIASTPGQELTYTCVPVGSGVRVGVDRDEDGFFDRDELDQNTDPADPTSFPGATTTTTTTTTSTSTTTTTLAASFVNVRTRSLKLKDDSTPPADASRRKLSFRTATKLDPPGNRVFVPAAGGPADPTLHGATLRVYNSSGLTSDNVPVDLPPGNWQRLGSASTTTGWKFTAAKNVGFPVTKITVKTDSITLKAGGASWLYTLNEVQQGRIAVRLTLGSGATWCADAPAKASVTGANDRIDKFVAQSNTPAPPVCPPTP